MFKIMRELIVIICTVLWGRDTSSMPRYHVSFNYLKHLWLLVVLAAVDNGGRALCDQNTAA